MADRKEVKFRQSLHKHTVQTRERNLAERRLLQRKLRYIHHGGEKNLAFQDQEIRKIKDDIWRQEGLQEFLNSDTTTVHFPNINQWISNKAKQDHLSSQSVLVDPDTVELPEVSCRHGNQTSASLTGTNGQVAENQQNKPQFYSKSTSALWSRSTPTRESLKSASSCSFEARRLNCDYFPCNKDVRYTRIGFNIRNQDRGCNDYTTVKHVYAKSREGLIMDLESHSIRRPTKTSTDQTSRKISSLQAIFLELKKKSDENRPKDWSVNYGKPTSKRKLMRVARPDTVSTLGGF